MLLIVCLFHTDFKSAMFKAVSSAALLS